MPPKGKKSKQTSKRKVIEKKKEVKEESDVVQSKYFKRGTGASCSNTPEIEVKDNAVKLNRLLHSFYNQSCIKLAKNLLGQKMIRKLPSGELLSGIIVETEAYLGGEDKAAHSYNGKRTDRNEAMYMPPGTAYVYHIYGTYTCMNISSQGDGAAVLLRGLDVIDGLETMKKLRGAKRGDKGKGLKDKDIGNGPSKLTQALAIDKVGINKQDLTCFNDLWLEKGPSAVDDNNIIASARIGVDYAEEWAKKPLRFYIKGNKSVSVKDKKAEEEAENEAPTIESVNCAIQKPVTRNSAVEKNKKNSESNQDRLGFKFYNQPTLDLAKSLLGKLLVRRLPNGDILTGKIIETEGYLGVSDGACHCYEGKRTPKSAAMFMPPGTCYVYNLYYSYCCFNTSSRDEGAVALVRSLEPVEGIEYMEEQRIKGKKNTKTLKIHQLCNGPSKLCIAMDIDKSSINKLDLCSSSEIWIEEEPCHIVNNTIVQSCRIGLNSATEEWSNKPWRFYIYESKSVSVKDKEAEKKFK